MTDVIEHIETDVRERILVTAERLFREIGYRKTAVADIARALRMSSADIYRFSDSKKSINADVAHRLMWEVEASQLSPRANGHRAIARAARGLVEKERAGRGLRAGRSVPARPNLFI